MQIPGDGGDNLPLFPEEVDKLVVRVAALDQDVFGVMGEGEADNIVRLELSTTKKLQLFSVFQIIDNQQRPVPVFSEGDQISCWVQSQSGDVRSLACQGHHLLWIV